MHRHGTAHRPTAAEGRDGPPDARVIAASSGWSVTEYVCHAGPRQRPFEERRDGFTIAAVVEGSFNFRSDNGRALLYPGALFLGNHDACYECGHVHGTGDRCVAFHFAPGFFAEIAASTAGASRFRFPTPMLPVSQRMLPLIAGLEATASSAAPLLIEETVTRLGETIVSRLSGQAPSRVRVTAREERQVAAVLRHIEENAAEPLRLEALASVAGVSKYHFLRIFRRVVGMTPYQFLLSTRMRRAAWHLSTSRENVSSVAYDAGFGDLSTFNARFRSHFGMAPLAYRRRGNLAG